MTRPARALFLVLLVASALGAAVAPVASAGAPTDVQVAPGDGRLVLTWQGVADEFRVYLVEDDGDTLLGTVSGWTRRHIDGGLGDGVTRSYRVAAVSGGTEASSGVATGTTFPRTTLASDFATGADGFVLGQSGGGTVAWSSARQAILVTQPSGASGMDTVLSRALPSVWTDDDHTFSVEATVRHVSGGHDARLWALALTEDAAPGEIGARRGVVGIRVEENVDVGDGGHGLRLWMRDHLGTVLVDEPIEMCYSCSGSPAYRVGVSYDAKLRTVTWSVAHLGAPLQPVRSAVVGATDHGWLRHTHLAIASDAAPTSGTASHTVDDLTLVWKRAEAAPTMPHLGAQRQAAGGIGVGWSPPDRPGAEPVTSYVLHRDGVLLGTYAAHEHGHDDGTAGRWARHQYALVAVSEIGPSQPRSVVVGSDHGVHVEDVHPGDWIPQGWTESRTYSGFSYIGSGSSGTAGLDFDASSMHRRAAVLDGQPWDNQAGSFYAESAWREDGSGRRVGACLLAILPASGVGCEGPSSIVGQFRAENRSTLLGGSDARALLRFVDAGGVERIHVSHPVEPGTTYRFNATFDRDSQVLTLRLLDENRTLLASGAWTMTEVESFKVGHVGIVAGLAPYGSGASLGQAEVTDLSFGFWGIDWWGVPAAPDVPAVESVGTGQVQLTWPPLADATSYLIYRAHAHPGAARTLVGTTTGTSLLDADAPAGTSLRYQVAGRNGMGEGLPSGRAAIRTWSLPPAPTSISTTTGPGRGEVTVAWGGVGSDPGGAPTVGFEVLRDGVVVATPGPAERRLVDAGLSDGATHLYRVRTVNAAGAGPASSPRFGTTAALPFAPVFGVPQAGPGLGEVRLQWSSSAALRIESIVHRAVGDGPLEPLATTTGLSFTDTGLAPGTPVRYAVQVRNVVGTGPLSTVRAATAPDVPGAPLALAAAPGPQLGQARLSWDAPATDGGLPVTGHRVYRDGALVATLGASTRTYVDAGLQPETTYAYEVAAVSSAGEGARAAANATTWADRVPGAVRDLAAARAGTGTMRVTWTEPTPDGGPPLTAYRVYRVGGPQGETLAATVTSPVFVDTPTEYIRQPALAYTYRVVAVSLAGAGASTWTEPMRPLA